MVTETKITVRYAETDQMAVVHHSVYPVWFEAARGEYIRACGMGYDEVEKLGFMLPLHDLQCTYIRPCRYEETVTIKTKVVKCTPAKIQFLYEVYGEEEEKPRIKGSTTHAWVRSDTFQMVNLKKEAPQLYELLLAKAEVAK